MLFRYVYEYESYICFKFIIITFRAQNSLSFFSKCLLQQLRQQLVTYKSKRP